MQDSKQLDSMTAKEKSRLGDYQSTFGSEQGKRVLQDLMDKFMWQNSSVHCAAGNALGLAFIDGQRMLMRGIHRWVETPIEEALQAYRKPLEVDEGDPLNGGQSTGTEYF